MDLGSDWARLVTRTLESPILVRDPITLDQMNMLDVSVHLGCGTIVGPTATVELSDACPTCKKGDLLKSHEQYSPRAPGNLRLTTLVAGEVLKARNSTIAWVVERASRLLNATGKQDLDADVVLRVVTRAFAMGTNPEEKDTGVLLRTIVNILQALYDLRVENGTPMPLLLKVLLSVLSTGKVDDVKNEEVLGVFAGATLPLPVPSAAEPPDVATMNVTTWLTYTQLDIRYQFLGLVQRLLPTDVDVDNTAALQEIARSLYSKEP